MANDLAETPILVVDNASEVKNITEELREAGFIRLSTFTDGLSALSSLKKNRPDIVIANMSLPKYSGIQLYKSITQDKALASIKFILTTPKLTRRELADLTDKEKIPNVLPRPFSGEDLKGLIFELYGFSSDLMDDAAVELYDTGMKQFEEEEYEDALKNFRDASNALEKPEYSFMQGRCYLELGLYDQSVAAFRNTITQDRNYPEVDYWLGIALQKKKDYDESIISLKRAANTANPTTDSLVGLGKSYLAADKKPEADKAFAKATDLDPNNAETQKEIGNAYLEHGSFEKAEKAFGDAINISPDNIVLYNRMAIALRKQTKYDDAIKIYMRALKIEPANELLFYNLARALHESGNKEKAVQCLNKALSLAPEFAQAKTLLTEYSAT